MLDINTLCTTKCVMSFVAGIRKVVHLVKLIRTSELYMRIKLKIPIIQLSG